MSDLELKNEAPAQHLAKLITLPQIFFGKLFRIPDYQRGYTWGSEQVLALLDDVEQLFNSNHSHYTGTVVIIEREHPSPLDREYGEVFDIIDGQQRLTTFSILLSCLANKIEVEIQRKELSELYFYRGEPGNESRVFKLNKNADSFFRSCVLEQKQPKQTDVKFISHKYIANAQQKISTWLEDQIESGRSAKVILDLVTSKFGFIVYRPLEANEAGMMFEVINNRGKPLSELEKVKNYLVYYAIKKKKKSLQEKVNLCWGEILRNLAKAHNLKKPDEQALLRAAVVSYFGFSKDDSSKIYETLKDRYPLDGNDDDWSELVDFVEYLARASSYYECVLNDRSEVRNAIGNNEIIEQVERFRSQKALAPLMPLYFSVMEKHDELGDEQVVDLLRMIEILSFRVYMTRSGAKRSDSGQADLYRLAHYLLDSASGSKWLERLANEGLSTEHDVAIEVLKRLHAITLYYCNDEKLEEGLRLRASDTDDFYDWSALRYFLMNYEQDANPKRTIKIDEILKGRVKGKSNDTLSIEHIWATENILAGSNSKQAQDIRSKRRIGNFSLLEFGINSQAGKKDVGDKVRIYDGENKTGDKSNLVQIHQVVNDYEQSCDDNSIEKKKKFPNLFRKVNLGTIDRVEKRYIDFALKRWSVDWVENYWQSEK